MTLHPVPSLPPRAVVWEDFARSEPDLAGRVRARFEAATDHVLASRTSDGAPRVSGTRVRWLEGRLVALVDPTRPAAGDLLRDPRAVLHANPGDGSRREGDALLRVRAMPVASGGLEGFSLQVTAVEMTTTVDGGVRRETWSPSTGLQARTER